MWLGPPPNTNTPEKVPLIMFPPTAHQLGMTIAQKYNLNEQTALWLVHQAVLSRSQNPFCKTTTLGDETLRIGIMFGYIEAHQS